MGRREITQTQRFSRTDLALKLSASLGLAALGVLVGGPALALAGAGTVLLVKVIMDEDDDAVVQSSSEDSSSNDVQASIRLYNKAANAFPEEAEGKAGSVAHELAGSAIISNSEESVEQSLLKAKTEKSLKAKPRPMPYLIPEEFREKIQVIELNSPVSRDLRGFATHIEKLLEEYKTTKSTSSLLHSQLSDVASSDVSELVEELRQWERQGYTISQVVNQLRDKRSEQSSRGS
ncbi:hypothetical protein IQ268_28150 [Oculatella sp. LEGE 06141]|uniref:hypothetical protein n=1 Tax=Oculatella sp. LEGE 06141 TaxID=1828648 RepID=UPI001881984C|nr:hypothetical protein [Oculatella sp. LEGE 06141]MBE9182425.1 hypothetical protein [Oculatella sp. LEGE 06141]